MFTLRHSIALAILLTLALALVACGSATKPDPTTTSATSEATRPSTATPMPTPTYPPTATATAVLPTTTPVPAHLVTPEPTPTITPSPTPVTLGQLPEINNHTTWQEVYDTLMLTEQSCIQANTPESLFSEMIEEPVMVYHPGTSEWDTLVYGCLHPDTARSLLFAETSTLPIDEVLTESETACVSELVERTDIASVIASRSYYVLQQHEDAQDFYAYYAGFFKCAPDLLVNDLLGSTLAEVLKEDEAECLRSAIRGMDDALIIGFISGAEEGPQEGREWSDTTGLSLALWECASGLIEWLESGATEPRD